MEIIDNIDNIDLVLELGSIKPEAIKSFDILCLPENYGSTDMVDSSGTLDFYKTLKEEGFSCANSYDLDINSKVIERRGNDIWLGQLFIINDFVIPGVMAALEYFIIKRFSSDTKQLSLTGEPEIHMEIKFNKKGKISKIKFDGSSKDALKIIKAYQ